MSTIYGNSGATQLDAKRPENTMRSVPLTMKMSSKASPIIARMGTIKAGKGGMAASQKRGY